ncbi:hypothetical protein MXB_964 [Myxobolus squamalis]|nr:hypothetical protein MXB_964 [Myxobolus squamalis]
MHSLFTIRASKKPIDCVKFITTTKFLTRYSQDDGEIFIHDLTSRRQIENYKPRDELILNFDCDKNNLIWY